MTDLSIVMTTFNRPRQLLNTLASISRQFDEYHPAPEIIVVDDGDDDRTPGICDAFHVRYLRVGRPQSTTYRNQALPLNIGIRAATGQTLILQNAECRHVGHDVVTRLVAASPPMVVAFAHVTALNRDGLPALYCGPENPRPYFFCGAISREVLMDLHGFDEDYVGYGYEDDDMADRLKRQGFIWNFTDIPVEHQWHPVAGSVDMTAGLKMYMNKLGSDPVRNRDREWGVAL